MPAPELRLVLAISLDGRLAPAAGGAAQLGGTGDRRVLEEALAWADGALVGGRTIRQHGCTCLIRDADLLEQRQQQGRPPQPAALVVSRQLSWDPDLRLFQQPLQRWLLGPWEAAPAGFDRSLPLQNWPATLAALAAAGLERLLVLGGAELATQLLAEGLVDELQLTLVPQLLGGPHAWLQSDRALEASAWTLEEQRCLGGDELLVRYRRA